jgi:hypothetical protein
VLNRLAQGGIKPEPQLDHFTGRGQSNTKLRDCAPETFGPFFLLALAIDR